MYAVVDIETTGGYADHHRVTEIAIYHYDGDRITMNSIRSSIRAERSHLYYGAYGHRLGDGQ